MGGAVPPLPQYAFMTCSVRGSTGTTYLTKGIYPFLRGILEDRGGVWSHLELCHIKVTVFEHLQFRGSSEFV
jgi:hypothetical protein